MEQCAWVATDRRVARGAPTPPHRHRRPPSSNALLRLRSNPCTRRERSTMGCEGRRFPATRTARPWRARSRESPRTFRPLQTRRAGPPTTKNQPAARRRRARPPHHLHDDRLRRRRSRARLAGAGGDRGPRGDPAHGLVDGVRVRGREPHVRALEAGAPGARVEKLVHRIAHPVSASGQKWSFTRANLGGAARVSIRRRVPSSSKAPPGGCGHRSLPGRGAGSGVASRGGGVDRRRRGHRATRRLGRRGDSA